MVKEQDEIQAFWDNIEKELGTPVLGKSLGRVVIDPVEEPLAMPRWGLFYTTKNAMYFHTFPSQNWFSMLMKTTKLGGKDKDDQESRMEIPIGEVEEFNLLKPKGFFTRLFATTKVAVIKWRPIGEGEGRSLKFEIDGDAESFVASLPLSRD